MHGASMTRDKIYDRMSADLPINAVVAPAVVDDPLEHGAKLKVIASLRGDPLRSMFVRDQLRSEDERKDDARTGRNTGDARFAAGRLWQRYREHSELGGARAIDPTREAVDGGRFKEPDISRMSAALAKLKQANSELQEYEASLVYDVLARNMTITEIAAARSVTSGRQISYLMERFRQALDSLAKLWGLATR
jgi:hypothetical protein